MEKYQKFCQLLMSDYEVQEFYPGLKKQLWNFIFTVGKKWSNKQLWAWQISCLCAFVFVMYLVLTMIFRKKTDKKIFSQVVMSNSKQSSARLEVCVREVVNHIEGHSGTFNQIHKTERELKASKSMDDKNEEDEKRKGEGDVKFVKPSNPPELKKDSGAVLISTKTEMFEERVTMRPHDQPYELFDMSFTREESKEWFPGHSVVSEKDVLLKPDVPPKPSCKMQVEPLYASGDMESPESSIFMEEGSSERPLGRLSLRDKLNQKLTRSQWKGSSERPVGKFFERQEVQYVFPASLVRHNSYNSLTSQEDNTSQDRFSSISPQRQRTQYESSPLLLRGKSNASLTWTERKEAQERLTKMSPKRQRSNLSSQSLDMSFGHSTTRKRSSGRLTPEERKESQRRLTRQSPAREALTPRLSSRSSSDGKFPRFRLIV